MRHIPTIMYTNFMGELCTEFESQQPATNNPLSGFYLVRTFTHDSPFTTLSDLPEEEAQAIMKGNYGHIDDDNMMMRGRVQEWLKEGADRAGIETERQNPIYFAVVKDIDNYKQQLPDGYNAVSYPMDQVDLDGWTFTMDDSFISAPAEAKGREYLEGTAEHDLHGQILTAEDVMNYLGADVVNYEQKGEVGHVHQFEAQMWDKVPKLVNTAQCPMARATPLPQPS